MKKMNKTFTILTLIISLAGCSNVNEVINNINENNIKQQKVNDDKKIKNVIMFIGDGINDAPVLAMANIGVSMGQIGSDAAIEASDVVILNDDISLISKMIKIAKKTRRIVFENIFISIGIKIAVLILTVLGLVGIEFAIFADVGVCVIAVLNAMRALYIK